jgi:hypothetical protein
VAAADHAGTVIVYDERRAVGLLSNVESGGALVRGEDSGFAPRGVARNAYENK